MAEPAIAPREFVLVDYDAALALWETAHGIEVCEGDSREEIGAYLGRNPRLSRTRLLRAARYGITGPP